MDIPWL